MIEIDLNARILPEDHNVYVIRPGSSYGLFSEITQQSTLILELPGLDLTSGQRPEEEDLRRRVNRSRALRGWYNGTREADSKPEMELERYSPIDGGASASQLVGLVRTFFERMKVGDLVIVPPKSYMDDAWIGEVTGGDYEIVPVRVGRLFGDEHLPGREVRWIARLPKRDLPYEILDALQKPNAAFLVERSLRGRFYKIAYAATSCGVAKQMANVAEGYSAIHSSGGLREGLRCSRALGRSPSLAANEVFGCGRTPRNGI